MLASRFLALVAAYGYPFLLAASIAENTFLLGFFVPGDAIALVGGALAARGPLSFPGVYLAVTIGVALGSVLSFFIGAWGGIPLLARWGARGKVTHARLDALEKHFRTHGPKTVFVGCFVSGTKNLTPAVAGASRMGFGRFALFAVPATALRSGVVVGIGYVFGANVDHALELFHRADRWLLAGVVLAIAVWLVVRRNKTSRH